MLALGVDVDVNVDGEVEKIQRKDGGFGAKDGMEKRKSLVRGNCVIVLIFTFAVY